MSLRGGCGGINPRAGYRSYPMILSAGMNRWPIFVRMFGGELFSADGRRCLLDQPAAIRAIEFLADLGHVKHLCCLPLSLKANLGDLFGYGHFLTTWVTRSFLHARRKFTLGFAPLPHGARHTTHLRLDACLIPRAVEQPALVRDWLHFLLLPENQLFLSERADALSCHRRIGECSAAACRGKFPGLMFSGMNWNMPSRWAAPADIGGRACVQPHSACMSRCGNRRCRPAGGLPRKPTGYWRGTTVVQGSQGNAGVVSRALSSAGLQATSIYGQCLLYILGEYENYEKFDGNHCLLRDGFPRPLAADSAAAAETRPILAVPARVYIAVGRELNLWNDTLLDAGATNGWTVRVNCAVGEHTGRGFRFTPADTQVNRVFPGRRACR